MPSGSYVAPKKIASGSYVAPRQKKKGNKYMNENIRNNPTETKPDAPMIGSDGNIYNQVAIASKALKDNGLREEAKEMSNSVFRAGSYDEALNIIQQYVNPVDRSEYARNKDRDSKGLER